MNDIERQILVNQIAMMRALRGSFNHDDLKEKEAFTLNILHPSEKEKTAEEKQQDKTKDAFCEESEQ